ncbi:MAG: lytic transglycosylase [Rhizobiales bacterium 65-79]|jgi:lytic murein transglycosylase|nr:MAG: lytic transglycosylase [Rhizobiales bacterium 65-79]
MKGVHDVRFHPLFLALALIPATAHAQAQCGGDFGAWKAAVEKDAASAGVGQRGIQALEQATFNPEVVRRDHAQGVFTQTFIEFSTRMESAYRLKHGEINLKKYASVFQRAEQQYGVPGPVIAAFWGLETDFGAVQGNFSTLDALATLAHDCRRPDLFRPQLIALLKLIDNGTVPADVRGAWAGEIGQTQMLPKDYLAQGVDGDGDGRVDLRGSAPDVIMTTAHFLQSLGWKAGEPWMEEVRVPDNLPWEQTGRENRLPISQWASWGVTDRNGGALDETKSPASLVLPMGRKGPAFLVFDNYDVYLKWNQSFVYTLTAAHLATRFAGAPAYDRRNPDPGLSPAEMRDLQLKLDAKGHDVGKVDGVLGSGTREAVRAMQKQLGLPVDGWPTRKLLDMM